MLSPIRRLHSCIAAGSYARTWQPAFNSLSIKTSAGASRISSVSGLNANPQRAIVLPFKSPLKCFISFSNKILFCRPFTSSTALSTRIVYPFCSAVLAFTSLGKQEPPYPIPGYKNLRPMRVSEPIPLRTIFTSAPTISQRFAISFIKLIRVANIEFAAYLVISADGISMKITRKLFNKNGLYNLDISFSARADSTPTTTRSGLIKSLIAFPSFRNSGLEATSKSTFTPLLSSSS